MTALEKVKAQTIAAQGAVTPLEMLNQAVANGASIETIEKMMGLHERWEANQARKSFDEAVAAAKAQIPPIIRNSTGHNNKRYADFAAIARVVDPIITQHGLSYRFRTQQNDRICVTCILSHRAGHSEETTLAGPADASGSKNAIQAIGSTLTYLQRYTLVQALGLAASNDDDAQAAGAGETISDEQFAKLSSLADEKSADKAKFCEYFGIAGIIDLPAKRYTEALNMLNAKKVRS